MSHPRVSTQPIRALMGAFALLCLAACAPTSTVSVLPTATATATTAPTATATPRLAPTPTNVPVGWTVLATERFSIAYPQGWTIQTVDSGLPRYFIASPTKQSDVIVAIQPNGDVSQYCVSVVSGAQHVTFAGLPMTYHITGAGDDLRSWVFANTQHTLYTLDADDAHKDAATQAQDQAILSTFRPDNADPWTC